MGSSPTAGTTPPERTLASTLHRTAARRHTRDQESRACQTLPAAVIQHLTDRQRYSPTSESVLQNLLEPYWGSQNLYNDGGVPPGQRCPHYADCRSSVLARAAGDSKAIVNPRALVMTPFGFMGDAMPPPGTSIRLAIVGLNSNDRKWTSHPNRQSALDLVQRSPTTTVPQRQSS